jgi:hypothetical protein
MWNISNLWGSMITNYATGTCEIESRIAMAKAAFNKKKKKQKKNLSQQIGHKFKEEFSKMLRWECIVCVVETWMLRKLDQKYLGNFKIRCWRRMEKINSIF